MDPFLQRLENWREFVGLTHTQFAELLGVDKATWSVERRREIVGNAFVGRVVRRHPWLARFLDAGPPTYDTCPKGADDGQKGVTECRSR